MDLQRHITSDDFWQRCVDASVAVLPVRVFSKYGDDGNVHDADFVGIRFVALPFGQEAVGPDFYVCIEEGCTGMENLHASPDEALAAAVKARPVQSEVTEAHVGNKPLERFIKRMEGPDGGWTIWESGEPPIDTVSRWASIELRQRNGFRLVTNAGMALHYSGWVHGGKGSDIVAFRRHE